MNKIHKIIIIGVTTLVVLVGVSYYAFALNNNGEREVTIGAQNAVLSSQGAEPSQNNAVLQEVPVLAEVVSPEVNRAEVAGNTGAQNPSQPVLAVSAFPSSQKLIDVDLSEQRLRYFESEGAEVGSFLISSGVKSLPTPKGVFYVKNKIPSMLYRGADYYLPNTKWNLQFLPQYFVHGAYWHNNFGHPMSHGCINVSYADMEGLYNWAEIGTKIVIHE